MTLLNRILDWFFFANIAVVAVQIVRDEWTGENE